MWRIIVKECDITHILPNFIDDFPVLRDQDLNFTHVNVKIDYGAVAKNQCLLKVHLHARHGTFDVSLLEVV